MMRGWHIYIAIVLILLVACAPKENVQDEQFDGKEQKVLDEQLIRAAERGDIQAVKEMLQQGAQLNAVDADGKTAVVAATYKNQVDVVELLIQEGADINIQDDRRENVILHAGANGYLEIVKLAIAADADMTITNRFGGTGLIPAAERGHVEVVETFLKTSKVDVNHINNLHWTALIEAVILGDGGEKHQQIVQLLMDYGADASIGDENGITALEHAKQLGFQEIIRILEEIE